VSYDIFLQRFKAGESVDGGAREARAVLAGYLVGAPDGGYARLCLIDGEADVYGIGEDSLMFNEISGEQIWQVIVDVARASGQVILPLGGRTCVLDEVMLTELPEFLRTGATIVTSGPELLAALQAG
jgi:hypothetical protein